MKKLLFVLMSFALVSCGSEAETTASEEPAPYCIKLGEAGEETDDEHKLGFFSDKITQETEFTLNDATLKINGMTEEFDSDPMSVEGKNYEGEVAVEMNEFIPCTISISKVTQSSKDDMLTNYDIEGKIKTDDEEGTFKVSMFQMN